MILMEKAIDRYWAMFKDIPNAQQLSPISNAIDWAMRTLKRQDRITWYLRGWRTFYDANTEQGTKNVQQTEMRKLRITEQGLKYQSPVPGVESAVMGFDPNDFQRIRGELQHWMSLNSPDVQNLQWSWQLPQTLKAELTQLEKVWQEKLAATKQWIDMDGHEDNDVETIMTFPDGFAWFNLNRSSCDREAEAMGHCGNAAADDGTVLSLRHQENRGGRIMWRPVATFIYHDGVLGEMKGRANKKPEPKYHPYIVALLKNTRLPIEFIRGGGHAPHENFALSDLDPKTQKEVIAHNPALEGLLPSWKKVKNIQDQSFLKSLQKHLKHIRGSFNIVRNQGTKYVIPLTQNGLVILGSYGESIEKLAEHFSDSFPWLYQLLNDPVYPNPHEWSAREWLSVVRYCNGPGMDKLHQKFGDDHGVARALAGGNMENLVRALRELIPSVMDLKSRAEDYVYYMDEIFAIGEAGLQYVDNEYRLVMKPGQFVRMVDTLLDIQQAGDDYDRGNDSGDLRELYDQGYWDAVYDIGTENVEERLSEEGLLDSDGNDTVYGGSHDPEAIETIAPQLGSILQQLLSGHYGSRLGEAVIKLRGFSPAPGAREFLEKWETLTNPNPMNERERILGGCAVQVYKYGSVIWIGSVRALDPRKGFCGRALEKLKELSDEFQIPLGGHVKALGDDPKARSQPALVQWYLKHGFQVRDKMGEPHLSYRPRAIDEDIVEIRRLAGL